MAGIERNCEVVITDTGTIRDAISCRMEPGRVGLMLRPLVADPWRQIDGKAQIQSDVSDTVVDRDSVSQVA